MYNLICIALMFYIKCMKNPTKIKTINNNISGVCITSYENREYDHFFMNKCYVSLK